MTLLAIASPQGGTIVAQDVSPGSANLAHPSPPGTALNHPTPSARVPSLKGLKFLSHFTQHSAFGCVLGYPVSRLRRLFPALLTTLPKTNASSQEHTLIRVEASIAPADLGLIIGELRLARPSAAVLAQQDTAYVDRCTSRGCERLTNAVRP